METKVIRIGNLAQWIGLAFGIYFAHSKKSDAWGYVGYAVLWSVVFGSCGAAADYTVATLKKTEANA